MAKHMIAMHLGNELVSMYWAGTSSDLWDDGRPVVMQMASPQLVWISKGLGGVNQRKQRRLYA